MADDNRLTLQRGTVNHDVQPEQVNTDILRRLFGVDPSQVWLKDEIDDTAFFPSADGDFRLKDNPRIAPYVTLIVEGPDQAGTSAGVTRSATAAAGLTSSNAYNVFTSGHTLPTFRSVVPHKKCKSFNVKVTKANMCKKSPRSKPEFNATGQMYIDLLDSTANTEHVLEKIRKRWGAEYLLVTSDGLKLEDSTATRGLAFWKSPSRKLYAISSKNYVEQHSEITGEKRFRTTVHVSESEEIEDVGSTSKKRVWNQIDNKLDMIMSDMTEIKEAFDETMMLSKDSNIPPGLRKSLRETFRCRICLQSITPPVVITKCCRIVIGCEKCVNSWFRGEDALTKPCPSCRMERGYNETMVLRGLDDFLQDLMKCNLQPLTVEGQATESQ